MAQLAGDPPDNREAWSGLLPAARLLIGEAGPLDVREEGRTEESGGRGRDPLAGGEGGCS